MKAASDDNGDTPATGPQTPRSPCDGLIRVGSLVIDEPRRVAYRAGRQLALLPRQFALLIYLASQADKVVSRRAIARDVWGDETAMWTNVITVNINGLRKETER